MIKRLFTAMLACLMLLILAACGSPDTSEETVPPTSAPAETAPPPEPTRAAQESAAGSDILQVRWDTDNSILLLDAQGVCVYLCKDSDYGNIVYDLQIKNNRTEEVELVVSDLFFNEHIIGGATRYYSAKPESWCEFYTPLKFPLAYLVGELDRIYQLSFKLDISGASTGTLLEGKTVQVDMSGNASLKARNPYDEQFVVQEPCLEFYAPEEQLLLEKDGVRVSLLTMGRPTQSENLTYLYRVENTSDQPRMFSHGGTVVNDVYFSSGVTNIDLRPGARCYNSVSLSDLLGMERIGSVKLGLGVTDADSETAADIDWYTVEPQSAAANPSKLKEGDTLLLEEQGLRVSLKEVTTDYDDDPIWTLVIVNGTDQNLSVELLDVMLGDQRSDGTSHLGIWMGSSSVGAHQTALIQVHGNGPLPVSFRLEAWDFNCTQPLFATEGRVELAPASE